MRAILLVLMIFPLSAVADTYLYTGAWSEHPFSDQEYNETHNLLAAEHNRFIAGHFVNSFSDDTFFAAYRWPWQLGDFELSFMAGGMYGYRDCKDPNTGEEKSICPMVAPAVVYTRYRAQPTIVVLGNAVAVSVRWRL